MPTSIARKPSFTARRSTTVTRTVGQKGGPLSLGLGSTFRVSVAQSLDPRLPGLLGPLGVGVSSQAPLPFALIWHVRRTETCQGEEAT